MIKKCRHGWLCGCRGRVLSWHHSVPAGKLDIPAIYGWQVVRDRSACVCCAGMTRKAARWSRSRQMTRGSSGRWRQRSRRSTGEGLGTKRRRGGQTIQLVSTRHPDWSCTAQEAPTSDAADFCKCRNFEKAAHEVLAASKRHQMHAKISCLSFIRRKPLDELSVSCTAQ